GRVRDQPSARLSRLKPVLIRPIAPLLPRGSLRRLMRPTRIGTAHRLLKIGRDRTGYRLYRQRHVRPGQPVLSQKLAAFEGRGRTFANMRRAEHPTEATEAGEIVRRHRSPTGKAGKLSNIQQPM